MNEAIEPRVFVGMATVARDRSEKTTANKIVKPQRDKAKDKYAGQVEANGTRPPGAKGRFNDIAEN